VSCSPTFHPPLLLFKTVFFFFFGSGDFGFLLGGEGLDKNVPDAGSLRHGRASSSAPSRAVQVCEGPFFGPPSDPYRAFEIAKIPFPLFPLFQLS